MKIFTTAVIKGGTGKSTTAAALSQAAAAAGKKVLAIDLDPSGNLSRMLDADLDAAGSYELLHGGDPEQLIQRTNQGLDVISAGPDLATEKTGPRSALRLKNALEPILRKYQFVFIDTPPTMGELTYNALNASTGLIIPLEADTSSIQGLYNIREITELIQAKNPELRITGAVLTKYDGRAKLNRYLRDTIEDACKEAGIPYLSEIRAGVSIKEAQAFRRSLFEYAPRSKPAEDYKQLFKKIQKG